VYCALNTAQHFLCWTC